MSDILSNPLYPVALAGLVALIFAYVRSQWVEKNDPGTERMIEISGHIREGAMTFISREYRMLAIFVIVVAVLLGITNASNDQSHPMIALAFVAGAFCSGLAGYIGMRVATNANTRTAAAARTSLSKALMVAFSGGSVMGMSVVGLGLLGLSVLVLLFTETSIITTNQNQDFDIILNVIAGFSLGASSIALFARVGGGIFTKAADVGADLVGKVEAGIPEDDPRNPATIADNVGDNVGDVAGMGADLFESYVGSIIGAMVLGFAIASTSAVEGFELVASTATNNPGVGAARTDLTLAILPLILAAVGIAASLLGTFFVRVKEGGDPQKALHTGTLVAAVIMITGAFFAIDNYLGQPDDLGRFLVFRFEEGGGMLPKLALSPTTLGDDVLASQAVLFSVIIGLVVGTLIGIVTEYFTSDHYKPVKFIARQSLTGAATNIIAGSAVGMMSTAIPVLLLVVGIMVSFEMAGVYGVAIAALGMLSTTGIQLAVDAYGPIADNAGGIAEMAKLGPEVRERTDKLDAVGNTTAAIGKGFAIGSAALTALALFAAFMTQIRSTGVTELNVLNPEVMSGLLVGAMLPFLFSAMALLAVGRAAGAMIEEVRRQFREIPGLLEGTGTADYRRCIEISTNASLREMILPGLLAITVPVIVGLISLYALGGLLVGVTVSGVLMALFQSNAGGAWDNAKKYVEAGNHGGKGSEAHKAAVTGDTVGDPYKDTAGPSLNILIKLISVVALVTAPALVSFHGTVDQKLDARGMQRKAVNNPSSLHQANTLNQGAGGTTRQGTLEYSPCTAGTNACSGNRVCENTQAFLARTRKQNQLNKADLTKIERLTEKHTMICVAPDSAANKKAISDAENKDKAQAQAQAAEQAKVEAAEKEQQDCVANGGTFADGKCTQTESEVKEKPKAEADPEGTNTPKAADPKAADPKVVE
jgi:K(+)-stimulated pyrophosphate-energized sodium pump